MRTLTSIRSIAIGTLIALGLLAARPASAIQPTRIITYNTALMDLKATVTLLVPPWQKDIAITTNGDKYGGQSYTHRVEMIADQIKRDDPDVVILNEVWDDNDKDEFVKQLSTNGDYDSYIRKVLGPIPGYMNPFATPGIQDDIQATGDLLGSPPGAILLDFIAGAFGLPTVVDLHIIYQDAGIMLFSKSKFANFTRHLARQKDVVVWGSNQGANWGQNDKEVAVDVFTRARGMDELAGKAVAMVRIERAPGDFINVAFSHSNADENALEENEDVRAWQMGRAKRMIRRALRPVEAKEQPVYMLGDLNTPGTNEKYAAPASKWSNTFGANAANNPWQGNPGKFFACGHGPCTATAGAGFKSSGSFMTDAFGFETSMEDRGKSNYVDQAYFDYVLHSRPARQCMQHITIGNEMQDDVSKGQLSDHLPVHADFNLSAPRCTPDFTSPDGPEKVQLDYVNVDKEYGAAEKAAITHPGSMQWYYIHDKGTYWIQTFNSGANVAYDVYNDWDLSNPIKPFHNETDPEQGARFVTTGPIFIRVFAANPDKTPNRTDTGDYVIKFHRATGATPWDSIALVPTDTEEYTWGGVPAGLQKVWFDIESNQTFGQGEFPDQKIVNVSYTNGALSDPKTAWKNEIYYWLGGNKHVMQAYQPVPGSPVTPTDNVENNVPHGYQIQLPDLPGIPTGTPVFTPVKYWLALSTDGSFGQPSPQNTTSYLTWTTDLQYLDWNAIESVDHKYWATERVRLDVLFDDFSPDACPDNLVSFMCSEMWLYEPPTVDTLFPDPMRMGPFKRGATPSVFAHHPLQIGNWYHLGHDQLGSQVETIDIAPGNPGTAGGCPSDASHMKGQCDSMLISDSDDYTYIFYYGVSHESPTK